MRRIPLYSKLYEQYFDDNIDNEIVVEPDNSLQKNEYAFLMSILLNNRTIMPTKELFIDKWPKFIEYIKRLLEHYDLIDNTSDIKDILYISRLNKDFQKIESTIDMYNNMKKPRNNIFIIFQLSGTLLYRITSDKTIHASEIISEKIGRMMNRLGMLNMYVQCGFALDIDKCKNAVTNRLDVSELSTEKFNRLQFQNTLTDQSIDEDELITNKPFTPNDFELLDLTYTISLYRLIRKNVITSDIRYMKSYNIFGTIKDSLDNFDNECYINGNKKDTENLLNHIILLLTSSNHPQRIWLYTSNDKVNLMLTAATNIVVTYNDERYIVAVEYKTTRTQDVIKTLPKSLSKNDKKLTDKFIDIASTITNEKEQVHNILQNMKVIPSNY